MTRYLIYNLSSLPIPIIQSFIQEMQQKGYKCYDYKVTVGLWYAIFDVNYKIFSYVITKDCYYTLRDATKRLEYLVNGCETIIETPDMRYKI